MDSHAADHPAPGSLEAWVSDSSTSPILKWAGGKRRLLGEISSRMPRSFGSYIEPFFGGGSVFFGIAPSRAIVGDVNRDLIEMYVEIAHRPSLVCDALDELSRDVSIKNLGGRYYEARRSWNADRGGWEASRRAATFIFLNKTCFNGLFRVNQNGDFNVPIGRRSAGKPVKSGKRKSRRGSKGSLGIAFPSREEIAASSALLSRAVIQCSDYEGTLGMAKAGDFAYVDPPYLGDRGVARSFTSYTATSFGLREHEQLADSLRRCASRGVLVMISGSDCDLTRRVYSGFQMDEVSISRNIAARSTDRGVVGELIMTLGYETRFA